MKLENKTLLIVFIAIIIGIIGYLLIGKELVIGYMLCILVSGLSSIALILNDE